MFQSIVSGDVKHKWNNPLSKEIVVLMFQPYIVTRGSGKYRTEPKTVVFSWKLKWNWPTCVWAAVTALVIYLLNYLIISMKFVPYCIYSVAVKLILSWYLGCWPAGYLVINLLIGYRYFTPGLRYILSHTTSLPFFVRCQIILLDEETCYVITSLLL